MELWNEIIIDRSWQLLQKLKKSIDFVLIGGWAVYLLTKAIKSKDIDIIIDFNTLSKLKEFGIRKNDKLKKYEIEAEGTDIDIYVPYYSKFILPVEEITKETVNIEGFEIPKPEILLILKQQAELSRKNTVKGQKDRIDILSLLMSKEVNFKFYKKISEKFEIRNYLNYLKTLIKTSNKEFLYLGIENPREVKKIKQKILEKIVT